MTEYQSIRLRLVSGFVTLLVGRFVYDYCCGRPIALLGYTMLVAGTVVFIWGCWSFAKAKGYPGAVGLLGFFSLIGLIILFVLPDRRLKRASPSDAEDTYED